ncbi:Ca(2+)-binding ATP:ADP antiporter SAL1 KNAG_0B05190 [Huiozyma naganishii CBS 8797]|uniref:EF-hand domain-containing protein n=1 Tax=Huiozyma naganishii (strain ATCC MYA-139 / BCRC 22969 / CBS 8797 / KCTC 17520 / NBRC 10181 / NCYC 3082 / Yp74L-3) TaxID=1071383 RepID=J7S537_HUIN7|nr:hypothetical protein KNAG_0B05190 [Kazachstania naganishii CBS 8797]CCK68951.1 hypothetical protein KNAG_0B05190 [Kazachstania naganishii CBS 8797]
MAAANLGETAEQRRRRHGRLFKRLDLHNSGQVDLATLREALGNESHPLSEYDKGIEALFDAMDRKRDGVIDFEEFQEFASQAEPQIASGFHRIDQDADGRVRRSEVSKYLGQLDASCTETDVHPPTPPKNRKVRLNSFLKWAFKGKGNQQTPSAEEEDPYITYDQWRDFLLLMPRVGGSRLNTAYAYFYAFKDDVDLSSEGDMTVTNEFIRGFSYFLAGGISGVISRTCTAPFDRIKVFLIARTDLSSTFLNSKDKLLQKNPRADLSKIKSPLVKAVTTLYRQGGLRAFYVGNGLNALKVFPESSIKFGTFEIAKKLMARLEHVESKEHLSKLSTYFAGGLAGMVSQFSTYPVDTLKFRAQCAPLDATLKGNDLLIHTAREMFEAGGLRIFYRGVTVGILGIFPYAALDLGTFTALKKWFIARKAKQLGISGENLSLSNLVVLPMGALSGTVGASVVYPINLLRTRLQAQGTYAHPYLYNGFRDVLQQTIKREGIPGLYKGLVPTLAKVCPAVSISYLCYENLKRFANLE